MILCKGMDCIRLTLNVVEGKRLLCVTKDIDCSIPNCTSRKCDSLVWKTNNHDCNEKKFVLGLIWPNIKVLYQETYIATCRCTCELIVQLLIHIM